MFDFLNPLELGWLETLHSAVSSPFMDAVVKPITYSGNAGIIWILCALALLCFKKTRRSGIALSITLVLCLVLNNLLLKNIFARLRPFQLDSTIQLIIAPPNEFSFPSGHALSSFACTVTITRFCKKRFGIAAAVWAVLISFTRIYLRVHFFTDVLGGAVIGIAIGLLACFISKLIFTKYDNKHKISPQ